MSSPTRSRQTNRGSMLIEALVALLIFSLGILAMMSVSRVAVSAQSDAIIRTEAARLANEIAQQMWLRVDRSAGSDKAVFKDALKTFEYQPAGDNCEFSGSTASATKTATELPVGTAIGEWLSKVKTLTATSGLPGSIDTYQQIKVESDPVDADGKPAGQNQVTINLCWKSPTDTVARQHTLMTQIN